MTTSTTYPNGQVLVSSALTIQQINIIVQSLTCGMLGIVPVDPALVRISWQFQSQPDVALPSQDVCYISCTTKSTDSEYASIARDRVFSGSGPVTETWNYTRDWTVSWDLYGVNCVDRARQIHSAIFMDYFSDQFELSNLYSINSAPEVTRLPVEHNAQWYDHTHFACDFYEAVTETIEDAAVTSVEVKVYDGSIADPVADVTLTV